MGVNRNFIILLLGVCIVCYALGELALMMRGDLEAADFTIKEWGAKPFLVF